MSAAFSRFKVSTERVGEFASPNAARRWILIWIGLALLYSVALYLYWGEKLNPDTYFYIVYWKQFLAGQQAHTFVVTTPKLLLSVLYGPLYLATNNGLLVLALTAVMLALVVAMVGIWTENLFGKGAAQVACALVLLSPDTHPTVVGANSVLYSTIAVIFAVQTLHRQKDFLNPVLIGGLFIAGLTRTDIWAIYPVVLAVQFLRAPQSWRRILIIAAIWLIPIALQSWWSWQLLGNPFFVAKTVGFGNPDSLGFDTPDLGIKIAGNLSNIVRFPIVWMITWARGASPVGLFFGLVGFGWLVKHQRNVAWLFGALIAANFISNYVLYLGRADGLANRFLYPLTILVFAPAGIGTVVAVRWLIKVGAQRLPFARRIWQTQNLSSWLVIAVVLLAAISWLTYFRSLIVFAQTDAINRQYFRAAADQLADIRDLTNSSMLLVPEQQMAETILRLGMKTDNVRVWQYFRWEGKGVRDLGAFDFVLFEPALNSDSDSRFDILLSGQRLILGESTLVPLFSNPRPPVYLYGVEHH